MECLIAFRSFDGSVGVILSEDGEAPEVFANRDAAMSFANSSRLLRAVDFQIIELDEI